ncbi:MAG: hypothetical protein ACUVQG_14140 [Thermogutta sp.]
MSEPESPKNQQPQPKIAGLLGIGLDGDDGQTRVTRGKNFLLWGGSKDTHSLMQETAIKVNERLDEKGKRMEDVSVKELRDIIQDVAENIGIKRLP